MQVNSTNIFIAVNNLNLKVRRLSQFLGAIRFLFIILFFLNFSIAGFSAMLIDCQRMLAHLLTFLVRLVWCLFHISLGLVNNKLAICYFFEFEIRCFFNYIQNLFYGFF